MKVKGNNIEGLFWMLFISSLLCFSSCTKVDTPPGLELRVVNTAGDPVSGVMLGLFDSMEEWSMRENPVQVWKRTDDTGRVLFVDLKEQIYFFFADGENKSNIAHEIRIIEALKLNEIRKITVTID